MGNENDSLSWMDFSKEKRNIAIASFILHLKCPERFFIMSGMEVNKLFKTDFLFFAAFFLFYFLQK